MSGDGPELCANDYCRRPLEGAEITNPARCSIPNPLGQDKHICGAACCDECIAGLTAIPPSAYGAENSKKANGCYDGFACSACWTRVGERIESWI